MSNLSLEAYRSSQVHTIARMQGFARKGLFFRLFLLRILPMGFLSGIKVKLINEKTCIISVHYKWLNKNPFRSTYFAVLSMAAEMSTGLPAFSFTYRSKPSISMLVTAMKADFIKKAVGITLFTFNDVEKMKEAIEQAVLTGEGITYECITVGTDEEGREVARFNLTWSFRVKIF